MKNYILPLGLAALLSACGGDGGGTDPNAAANAASDAFFSNVSGVVNAQSETDEPANIDSIAVGTSETLEPTPII